jgi:hypothetical protein
VVDAAALRRDATPATAAHQPIVRRDPLPAPQGRRFRPTRPAGRVLLERCQQGAPVRTWGSATFDSARGEILYWGGGHCGYGGSDVDAFDVAAKQWRAADPAPEFPERAWDKGVRLAGVTFQGAPWTEHGRRIYASDPVSKTMIMVRTIRSTTGYDPELLSANPAKRTAAPDAIVQTPSSYNRFATYSYDTQNGRWNDRPRAGRRHAGDDTTRVMGINVDWPSRLNDSGYMLREPAPTTLRYGAISLDAAKARWTRLDGKGASPQNLYELTSLAYDSKRERPCSTEQARSQRTLSFDVRKSRGATWRPRDRCPTPAAKPSTCQNKM